MNPRADPQVSPRTVLHVSTADPTPPYEQVRRQLVELITAGQVAPGARLPPVRQLASDLGLATGTVARAYRELEAAGLVVTRRGGGTRVNPDGAAAVPADAVAEESTAAALGEQMTALVRLARRLGASDEQLRAALDAALVQDAGSTHGRDAARRPP